MTVNRQEPDEEGPNEPPSEQSRLLAALAVQLHQEQKSEGSTPSMEEIWAWMHGELDEARSSEVKSHIARDPDTYSLWHDLRASRSEVEAMDVIAVSDESSHIAPSQAAVDTQSHNATLRSGVKSADSGWSISSVVEVVREWLQPKPLMGIATAVIVGSVFVKVMQPAPTADYWQDWQTPKSNASAASVADDIDALQSVLAGMNSAMRDLSIPALSPDGKPLPRETPDCMPSAEDAGCAANREALYELGQLVVEVRLICLTSYPVPESKLERLSAVAEVLVGTDDGKPFEGPVQDWLASDEARDQCAAVNTIVERALRGLTN